MEAAGQPSDQLRIFNGYQSLLQCCGCQNSPLELFMLNCLHNYCRLCVYANCRVAYDSRSIVKCVVCCEETGLSAVMTNSVLSTDRRSSDLSSAKVWCSICPASAAQVTAEFWCSDCCVGLCATCRAWHNRLPLRHQVSELDVSRAWSSLYPKPTRSQCSLHLRQMEAHCFSCSQPKCLLCCEQCRAKSHDMRPLAHKKTREHLARATDAISSIAERLRSLLSNILSKHRSMRSRVQTLRTSGHATLVQRSQRLYESSLNSFDTSAAHVGKALHRIWCRCHDVTYSAVSRRCTAVKFHASIQNLPFFHRTHLLKAIARYCVSSSEVAALEMFGTRKEIGPISVQGSVPLIADIVLSACLGATDLKRDAQLTPLQFYDVSLTFKTPAACTNVVVTTDGHVLLAAHTNGLLEYNGSGQLVSSWRPARWSIGQSDFVKCVAALKDGRVAVGVHKAKTVSLLIRNEAGDSWLEDRRVDVLQSPPWRLAAVGDLLAVVEYRWEEQKLLWMAGRQLKLLRLTSGQLLCAQCRDYDIWSVALSALYLVTTSAHPVKCDNRQPYVVDAFSHSGEFLWRYETDAVELLAGPSVSADSWSRMYVSEVRRDGSSSRVVEIGWSDGRKKADVITHMKRGMQLPAYISVTRGQRRTILAVLFCDETADQCRTVSLYEVKNLLSNQRDLQ